MAFNALIASITLAMAAFVLVWALAPRWRPWIEAPKYRVFDGYDRVSKIERETSGSGQTVNREIN